MENASTKSRTRTGLDEPDKYKVYIHNDDFTPMDFVVAILMSIFHKPANEAFELMMKVHNSGKAVAGVYSYDIVLSKIGKAVRIAREHGYPLRFTYEK